MKKRIVSLLLLLAMVVTCMPLTALANTPETVYISVSDDAQYVADVNGMPVAYAAVPLDELAGIDLNAYGLGEYLYDCDGDGLYEITALHLYIYTHETLLGYDFSEVGISGGAGSLYFYSGLFGFSDENLRYDYNGAYPSVDGWGMTADQIVLSDGDYLNVAHYTSWAFWGDSATGFHYFADENNGITYDYSVNAGENCKIKLVRSYSDWMNGGVAALADEPYFELYYGTSYGTPAGSVTTDDYGEANIVLPSAGIWYVWSDGGYGMENPGDIVSAPAYAKITVTAATPEPAAPIDVYVSIANKGELVMAMDKITVTDRDASGDFTVDEVLHAAHEASYSGGAAAGYASEMTAYGLSIKTLWGDSSGNYGYWLNDASCWSLADTVNAQDSLVAFVYQNTTVWDAYSRFGQDAYTALAEASVSVALEKAGYDANWNTVFAGHTGASIKLYDNNFKELSSGDYKVMDNGDGTYSVTVTHVGDYYVAAYDNVTPIVPAVCSLTVAQNPDLAYADAVEAKINAIGPVTVESESAIIEAHEAYDALTESQKALVSNYSTLTVAESTLEQLKQAVSDQAEADAVEEKISAIGTVTVFSGSKITSARIAYDALTDEQKGLVENVAVLTEAENELAVLYQQAAETDHKAIYDATSDYLAGLGTPGVGSTGGEWMVIDMTRAGIACPEGYYQNVVDYVNAKINDKEQLHRAKSTDNSRVILALTSAGYDVTDVDGHDLLMGLTDMSYVKKQGINGPIWALIAFDSHNYAIPANPDAAEQVTREKLIAYILEKQLEDGGWALSGKTADPDMTGMALQALAPYYATNSDVKKAVDEALACLSAKQYANGGFGSVDGVCAESCAQVIVALTALGIDPETDARFVKNGISVVDAMCQFALPDGGFMHVPGSSLNGMATEQSQYALAAYFRYKSGQNTLYDMTDVSLPGEVVANQIAAIGTVSLNSEKSITEARSAYDALSDYQRSLVDNYDVLERAEEHLAELKNADGSNPVTADSTHPFMLACVLILSLSCFAAIALIPKRKH